MIHKSLLSKMQSTSGWITRLLLLMIIIAVQPSAIAQEQDEPMALNRTLIVKGDIYYPPFEFINEEGKPDGFNVELFEAIANELGLKYTISLDTWSKVRDDMESGRIDVILGLIYSPQRAVKMDFTMPHTVMTHGIFTHTGKDYSTLDQLVGKEIVVQRSDIMHDYLIETGLTDKIITVASQLETLQLIASGKHDAALIGNFQGIHLIKENNIRDVKLRSSGMQPQKYAMAVKKGDNELLWSLNQGLYHLKENGIYDQLYEKWFTVYEDTNFLKKHIVLIYTISGLILAMMLFVILLRLQVNRAVKKAKSAEISFEKLIQNAPVGIVVSNKKRETLLVNNAFVNLTGYTLRDMPTADEWWQMAYPDKEYRNQLRERWDKEFAQTEIGGTSKSIYEAYIQCHDGNYKTVEVSFTVITDQLIVIIFNDLTLRKEAEKRLRENMEELDRFFTSSLDLLFIAESDGRLIKLNPEWENVLGYSSAELEGTSFLEYIHPEDKLTAIEAFSRFSQTNAESITSRMRCRTSDYKWIEWRARLVGKRIYAGARDVTGKIQSTLALKTSEEKYRLIAENTSDAIWILNLASNKFTYVSPSIYAMRGYTAQEVMNQSLVNTVTPEFFPLVAAKIEQTVGEFLIHKDTEKTRTILQVQQPCKDGRIIWIEVSAHVQFNLAGEIEIVGVNRDIEQRKAIEKELLGREETLRQLNLTKDKLLSIIAHDLKNPFSSIIGFSDLLLDDADELTTDEIKSYGKMIHNASTQAYLLLENLLHWARMQQGNIAFSPVSFNLHEMVNGVFAILKDSATRKEIVLENHVDKGTSVIADHNMINTVVRNLVSNAIKFTDTGGKIKVDASLKPDGHIVSVSDTGFGMSPEEITKLFSLISNFTKPGTANEKGTGLGLILCKDFIEKHGGEITVESAEGIGSTFSFLLPQNTYQNS